MKKRAIIAIMAVALLAAASAYFYVTWQDPDATHVDANKIAVAAISYSRILKAHGEPVPESVPLGILVLKGLLKYEDVSGFNGMEVTIFLAAHDPGKPQQLLAKARLPDGYEIDVLWDGSVQQLKPGK